MANVKISRQFPSVILDLGKHPIPSPFCINKKKVKAIVLGCDPSNFSDDGKTKIHSTVFGIGTGDYRYFRDIIKNLTQVGLNLENIYVQNVIPFYMQDETAGNKHWNEIAEKTLPNLINELDSFDKRRKIPVLLTSEVIYKFLLNSENDYKKPRDLYRDLTLVPIPKSKNKLGRKLFPIYRHFKYSLTSSRWEDYAVLIKNFIYG